MTREVYTNAKLIEFSRKHIFVRLFTDTDSKAKRLSESFRVRGFPAILVLDSSGREVDRLMGFRSAQDLMEELQEILDGAAGAKFEI